MKILPFSSRVGRVTATLTLAGAAGATALAMTPGTFGGFTATASNTGNTVQAGTVTMTDNVTGALTLSGLQSPYGTTNMEPGQAVTGSVTITNSGSLPVTATLALASASGNVSDASNGQIDPMSDWAVKITDDKGNTIYSGDLANVAATNLPPTSGSKWAPGEAHTYTVAVTLNSYASNLEQSSHPSFDLNWLSTQA